VDSEDLVPKDMLEKMETFANDLGLPMEGSNLRHDAEEKTPAEREADERELDRVMGRIVGDGGSDPLDGFMSQVFEAPPQREVVARGQRIVLEPPEPEIDREDIKQRIGGLEAVHANEPGYYSQNAVTLTRIEPSANALTAAHPIVITHPATGRKALYVNRLMTAYIVGMPREKSAQLLEWLFDHQEQSQFIYAHKWKPGDVVIWDNRCVNHARTDFDAGEARKLRRVVVETEDGL
jgi:hypothetical protein